MKLPAALRPPRQHTLAGLDGVRAIAALSIVALHVGFQTGTYTSGRWGDLLAHLDSGVAIFFVLSGFLLYRPFVAAHLRAQPAPAAGRYLVKRLVRVYPAYWVALLGSAYVFDRVALDSATQIAVHATLTRIYSADYFFAGMPQVWTLAVEVSFYIALPAIAWGVGALVRGRGARAVFRLELLAMALMYVAGLAVRAWLLATHDKATIATKWLPAELDWFALGMAIAVVSAAMAAGVVSTARVQRWARPTWLWWAAACGVLLIASYGTGVGADVALFKKEMTDAQDLLQQWLYGLFGAGVVVPIAWGAARVGPIRRLLSSQVVTIAGLASYGIFLWHVELLNWLVLEHKINTWVPSARFLSVFVVVAGLSFLLGLASYLIVEAPLGRWMARDRGVRR